MPLPKEPEATSDFEYEIEDDEATTSQPEAKEAKGKPDVDLEVVDDTPEEDRGREPLPKHIVEELDADELDDYSDKVKIRLKQMKKVWHDERRAKEAALREQQEAVAFTKKVRKENERLKATLSRGEKTLLDTYRQAAELEMQMATKAYKEAYEAGDSDLVVEAQKQFSDANYKLQQVKNYQPSLQQPENDVHIETEEQQVPRPDRKTMAWQERNPWWGTDPEMTALALGYHQKLEREMGAGFVGSDEYWDRVDKTMRTRFPEYFGSSGEREIQTTSGGGKPTARTDKPATVVAPASRSTSSKKVVLKQSEVNIAKKFGLTPEQYAREKMRLENQNG